MSKLSSAGSLSEAEIKQLFKVDSRELIHTAFDAFPDGIQNIPSPPDMNSLFTNQSNGTSTSSDSDNDAEIASFSTGYSSPDASSPRFPVPPNSRVLSPTTTPTPTPTAGFTWAFFNCPATLNIASLLLLTSGLFTLTVSAIAASASVAAAGAVMVGVGALLGIFGQFSKPAAENNINHPSPSSIPLQPG